MMSLDQLPPEVLTEIVKKLDNRIDVKSLCQVSRQFYHISVPVLYRSLVLRTAEIQTLPLVSAIESLQHSNLKYTRWLILQAPFLERFSRLCIHRFSDDDDANPDETSTLDDFVALKGALRLLFSHLQKDHLQSFLWELGTCIPNGLLEGEDSLFKNQQAIETLSLITDNWCGNSPDTEYLVDITPLRKLRSLSWIGLRRYDDFEAIRKYIALGSNNLCCLNLDLVNWTNAKAQYDSEFKQRLAQDTSPPDNFFVASVLGLKSGAHQPVFPRLKTLTLSGVSFKTRVDEMVTAMNVANLTSLTLRSCPFSQAWFKAIINSTGTLQLKHFELTWHPHCSLTGGPLEDIPTPDSLVAPLLQHCSGLQDLYLMFYDLYPWADFVSAVLQHRSTLRRLVLHVLRQGISILIDDNPMEAPATLTLLQSLSLECFGIFADPHYLRLMCELCSPRPTCRLLHLRTSPYSYTVEDDEAFQDFAAADDFARWAFSPNGLPTLQVLVYGDFSRAGRRAKYTLTLCRSRHGYETLTPDAAGAWELFTRNTDMLQACPGETMMMG